MNPSTLSNNIENAESIEARRPIQLQRMENSLSGLSSGRKEAETQIWFDAKNFSDLNSFDGLISRLPNFAYNGILLGLQNLKILEGLPATLKPALRIENDQELEQVLGSLGDAKVKKLIIVSSDATVLAKATELGILTCLSQYVDDGESLHRSIHLGLAHPYLMIRFRDPTNIPLELVIASLQATGTTLIKEISLSTDIDDAVVSLGTMEVGADGVIFSPQNHDDLETFHRRLSQGRQSKAGLDTATLVRSIPIGMGYRSCIDVATLFSPLEGMIVGSTSQGGFLLCPEVFYLPYMETRPFRVNAGAVHSYVYNADNRTNYMTELNSGSAVMIVGVDGNTRKAAVGRMKTELRPLRLVEARFESGETINVILQDDWHVRTFSPEGKPLNITDLKAGDKVLAHKAEPGRHVGIKIDEKILEN